MLPSRFSIGLKVFGAVNSAVAVEVGNILTLSVNGNAFQGQMCGRGVFPWVVGVSGMGWRYIGMDLALLEASGTGRGIVRALLLNWIEVAQVPFMWRVFESCEFHENI